MTRFMPLLLPPIDDTTGTLALRGLFIPGWVSPVADADYGINRAIVFTHLPNELPKDALCIIDPWNNQKDGDHVDVYLDGNKITEADVIAGEENQRLFLSLPHDRISPDWGEDFHFKLTRVGSPQPDDESSPVRLRIKLDRPGNKDREPNNPGHSELKAPLPPADIIRDGVDAGSALRGFDVEIKDYPNRAPHDTIQLAWGSAFVYRTVTPAEAATADSIFIRIDQQTILAGGDAANLLVHYMVFDEVWNYAEKYSLRTYLPVDAGAARLSAPVIKEASGGIIDLVTLGKENVTIQVVAQAPDFALNDTLEMTWIGTPVIGMPLVNSQTKLIDNLPAIYEFEIPNREIRAIAGGSGDAFYVLRKADGTPPLSSRHAFASVVGEVSSLLAPSIIELVGDTLLPDLAVANVVVHAYPGMQNGDFIQLVWLGEKANNGGPYLYEDTHPVSQNDEGTDITFGVNGEHIEALAGGTLDLYYLVSNDTATVYDVRESEHLEIKVNSIVAQLPPPKVVEAPGGILDPDLVTGNATLLVDYLGTAPGDILTYYWHGNPGDGTTSDWVPITTVTAGKPLSFTLLRAHIVANRDRMVQVRYTLKLAATGQYRYSGVLELLIGREVVPTITSVKGQPGNTDITDGGTTVQTRVILSGEANKGLPVQVYDGMNPVGAPVTAGDDGIWSLDISNLSVGFYSMTATALYGSGASSEVRTFHVAAEVTPEINRAQTPSGDVANGGTTVATSVTLYGSATANTQVEIFDGLLSRGTFDVDSSSEWTSTPITMDIGTHNFTAKTVGGTQTSAVWEVKVATEVKPVIDRAGTPSGDVTNGGTTVATSVTLYGTATANTQVEIFDGILSRGTFDVDFNSEWTSTPITMDIGTHKFTAKTVGGTQTSAAWEVNVATEVRPVINQAETPLGDVPNGGQTSATSVILHGTATANTQVEIFDNGTSKGTFAVNASEIWTSTSIAMSTDTHSFTAKTVGGTQTSTAWTIIVATEITPVINQAETPLGDVLNGGQTTATSVILRGTATANGQVEIFDNGTSKGIFAVSAGRVWNSTSIDMGTGPHSFTAKTVSGTQTSPAWVINVVSEVKPVINRAETPFGDVTNGANTVATSVTLHGTATPNTRVEILDSGTSKGTFPVSIGGVWTSTPIAMSPGLHSFTAKTVNGSETSEAWRLTVVATVTPTITSVKDPANTPIVNGGYTVETTLVLSGRASNNQSVEIWDGDILKGPADVNGNGVWDMTVTGLTVDAHFFKARARYGNNPESDRWGINVVAVVRPTITSVRDAAGNPITNGGSTTSSTVTLSGIASKGLKLEIFDGFDSRGQVNIDGNGNWSLPVGALAVRAHPFTAKALYSNNPVSDAWTINVSAPLVIDTSAMNLNGRAYKTPSWTRKAEAPGNTATRTASGGKPPYSYQSSNPAIASVNAGFVRGEWNGSATITVRDSVGNQVSYPVNVSNMYQVVIHGVDKPDVISRWIFSIGAVSYTNGGPNQQIASWYHAPAEWFFDGDLVGLSARSVYPATGATQWTLGLPLRRGIALTR